jgi:hypothetical protein
MITLGKGDNDDEEWLPFGVEDHEVAAFTALREDVPSWLDQSLWEWIAKNVVGRGSNGLPVMRTDLLRRAERVLHVTIPARPPQHVSTGLHELRDRYSTYGPTALLGFVDFLISDLSPDHSYLADLDQILVEAGSAWCVGMRRGKPGLVQRLPEGVVDAASATFKRGDAGQRLASAWESTFGLQPDPSNAYRLAVQAVEDATIPVVPTGKAEPTLGDIIRAIDNGTWRLPHLREHALASSHDVLVSMLRLLWRGHHDRHGGPSTVGVPAVTQDEAESAVMLAVTLVGWFDSGKVQQ